MINISGLEAKPYPITAGGLKDLQQQLDAMKKRRMQVAHEMREITSQTTEMGALQDSTLAINQNQATEIDGQINLLERIIGLAEIIPDASSTDMVGLGSRVTVKFDGKVHEYFIVGPVEADPLAGRISNESPIGQSLIGRRVDDKVDVATPAGTHQAVVAGIQ